MCGERVFYARKSGFVPDGNHEAERRAVGNIAWITSEVRTTGTYKGKAVDRRTVETMVLRRAKAGWKIVHIHWSSAAADKWSGRGQRLNAPMGRKQAFA